MKTKLLLFVVLVLLSNTFLIAGVGDWTTFTNQGDIRDIILKDNFIWCATNGGVFGYNISTGDTLQFNNTNGLTSMEANTVEIDYRGYVWVGFSDGWLNYFKPESNTWEYFRDLEGHKIYDLEAVGDSLILIASDVGIHLYEIQHNHIKENYYHLGWQLPEDTPVLDIMVNNQEIWAATESGIARADFEPYSINLKAPVSWTNYTMNHGLSSNYINSIVAHNDSIFAATDKGVAVLSDQYWFTLNQGLPSRDIKSIVSQNNQLYALTTKNVSQWESASNQWNSISSSLYELNCFDVTKDNNFWVGRTRTTEAQGLAFYSIENQGWEKEIIPPGPPGNIINCMAVDKNGILWCGSNGDGIFRYDGETWSQYTTRDGLKSNTYEVVTVDPSNRKWFGSQGGGVAIIDDIDSLAITIIHKDHLSGCVENENYIVITDIKIDRYNNVWILNLAAKNNNVVAVYSVQLQWQYFSTNEGIFSDAVRAISFDQYDRAWIGSDGGVNVIDYNNTLMDKSDDDFSGTLTTIDGLENNHIKDIAIDQDNIVWIATEEGLNYWTQGSVAFQYGLLSNSVNTIEIDIRNNKWFGTSAGVSVLAPDGYTWTHYSTDNSPIVSDNVMSFGFDYETGKVYIGTTNGLSCLETPYSRPQEDLSQVKAGPNPFFTSRDQAFAISKLADDVAIKFLTENGTVVRQISKDEILGSQVYWDGKNDAGEYVASGIYLYIIYNEETALNRLGKIAVLR